MAKVNLRAYSSPEYLDFHITGNAGFGLDEFLMNEFNDYLKINKRRASVLNRYIKEKQVAGIQADYLVDIF